MIQNILEAESIHMIGKKLYMKPKNADALAKEFRSKRRLAYLIYTLMAIACIVVLLIVIMPTDLFDIVTIIIMGFVISALSIVITEIWAEMTSSFGNINLINVENGNIDINHIKTTTFFRYPSSIIVGAKNIKKNCRIVLLMECKARTFPRLFSRNPELYRIYGLSIFASEEDLPIYLTKNGMIASIFLSLIKNDKGVEVDSYAFPNDKALSQQDNALLFALNGNPKVYRNSKRFLKSPKITFSS